MAHSILVLVLSIFSLAALGFALYFYTNGRQERKYRYQERENHHSTRQALEAIQPQFIESEKLSSLGRLTPGFIHEINTPLGVSIAAASNLNIVANHIKSASDGSAELQPHLEDLEESVELIVSNLNRASDLIQNFRTISIDQRVQEARPFDLVDYLKDVFRSLKGELRKKQVQLQVNNDKEILMVGFPGYFAQIFTNLIMNSIQHGFETHTGNEICIEYNEKDDAVVIEYRDNGKGVDPSMVDKIFVPFETSRADQGNSGLGMSIIRNLLDQLKGSIHVLSDEKKGFGVKIQVPKSIN